jgi:hypothetical protein
LRDAISHPYISERADDWQPIPLLGWGRHLGRGIGMSDGGWSVPEQPGGPGMQPVAFQAGPVMTPEQIAYQRGQQDAIRRLTAPRMTGYRIFCGIFWAIVAVGFGIGVIANLVRPDRGEALVGLVIALLAGWYDYRIWTLKARRLWLFI